MNISSFSGVYCASVVVSLLILFALLFCLLQWWLEYRESEHPPTNPKADEGQPKKYAYFTYVYPDQRGNGLDLTVGLGRSQVLCFQLKILHNTSADVVIYSTVAISNKHHHTRAAIIRCGCTFKLLKMPFKASELRDPKMTYMAWSAAELAVWKEVAYDKIIHLDSDLVITRSIDHLFQLPALSGVPDATAALNNGLFVLKPSLREYQALCRYWKNATWGCNGVNNFDPIKKPYQLGKACQPAFNRGPQGVLPAYFGEQRRFFELHERYNFILHPQTGPAAWQYSLQEVHVFHLIGCKPDSMPLPKKPKSHQIEAQVQLCKRMRGYWGKLQAASRATPLVSIPIFALGEDRWTAPTFTLLKNFKLSF
eukprot:NODE_3618_length_1188_cov_77.027230_g3437_i0.p1 GENE.NODE_3618_length_1188_cov_77.027230_g3437_i0~~NODE_3618_length_1188_cov_77.027230_g3437_i0.p1  ORF type:complete len:385 (-),score=48.63 NODE_3618_length_1188_cov_77.027230_g3437_i0:33-1133(-)